jgi:hypothetical protein
VTIVVVVDDDTDDDDNDECEAGESELIFDFSSKCVVVVTGEDEELSEFVMEAIFEYVFGMSKPFILPFLKLIHENLPLIPAFCIAC